MHKCDRCVCEEEMPPLNVNELDELFEEGGDNPEIVNRWYEKLSKVSVKYFLFSKICTKQTV